MTSAWDSELIYLSDLSYQRKQASFAVSQLWSAVWAAGLETRRWSRLTDERVAQPVTCRDHHGITGVIRLVYKSIYENMSVFLSVAIAKCWWLSMTPKSSMCDLPVSLLQPWTDHIQSMFMQNNYTVRWHLCQLNNLIYHRSPGHIPANAWCWTNTTLCDAGRTLNL